MWIDRIEWEFLGIGGLAELGNGDSGLPSSFSNKIGIILSLGESLDLLISGSHDDDL